MALEPLEQLVAILASKRAWRNIQPSVCKALELVGAVVVEQQRQVTTLHEQLVQQDTQWQKRLQAVEAAWQGKLELVQAQQRVERETIECSIHRTKELLEAHRDASTQSLSSESTKLARDIADLRRAVDSKGDTEEVWRVASALANTQRELDELHLSVVATDAKTLQAVKDECERVVASSAASTMSELRQQLEHHVVMSVADAIATNLAEACDGAAKPLDDQSQRQRDCELLDMCHDAIQKSHADLQQQIERNNSDIHHLQDQVSDVIAVVESLEDSTAQLHLAVGSKFTLEEASALFETKQSMIEWRDGLKKMHALVAAKPSKLDLEAVINQVHALAREFRGEIVQARYIWKIGRPSPDHTIHWNHQTVNTNASVFAWRQDADVVTLVVPGLYHVQAAFFSNLSPQLQVLINGEPVLIADEDDDSKLQHDSVGVVRRVPHSGGNLAGISLSAFLAVPARASLTLTYDLDEEAQGFLNVRKL